MRIGQTYSDVPIFLIWTLMAGALGPLLSLQNPDTFRGMELCVLLTGPDEEIGIQPSGLMANLGVRGTQGHLAPRLCD